MLKLKLLYFGHLMLRADSFEKTLTQGKIEGRRRRGWQTMRSLDGITDSMDMSLSKLRELVTGMPDVLQSMGSQRVGDYWATELSDWQGFPGGSAAKNLPAVRETRFNPWVRKIPWRRAWQSTPVYCLEDSMHRETWWATIHGIQEVRHDWAANTHIEKSAPENKSTAWYLWLTMNFYYWLTNFYYSYSLFT